MALWRCSSAAELLSYDAVTFDLNVCCQFQCLIEKESCINQAIQSSFRLNDLLKPSHYMNYLILRFIFLFDYFQQINLRKIDRFFIRAVFYACRLKNGWLLDGNGKNAQYFITRTQTHCHELVANIEQISH